jgi:hypothetical protein
LILLASALTLAPVLVNVVANWVEAILDKRPRDRS